MGLNPKFVNELSDEALATKMQECEAQIIKYKGDPEIVKEYQDDLKQLKKEQDERLGKPEFVSKEEFLELIKRVKVLEAQVVTLKGKVEKLK